MLDLTRPDGTQPEDLHLTRRTAVSMFFAGYALAAVAADAAPITTSADGLIIEEALIPNGAAKPLPAYVARPAGKGRHAAVIVVNEIFGVHDYIKDICRRLAREGYVAVAPEFFYRSGVNLPALTDFKQIMPVVQQASVEQVDGDVRATSGWLKRQAFAKPASIGITGFCWGGAVAWRAAMVDPDVRAGVAWYGQLKPLIARAGELKAPVLGLYGALDQGIPQTDVEAMRAALKAAGKDATIIVYPDAPHGFHADYRDSYREADAKGRLGAAAAAFPQSRNSVSSSVIPALSRDPRCLGREKKRNPAQAGVTGVVARPSTLRRTSRASRDRRNGGGKGPRIAGGHRVRRTV